MNFYLPTRDECQEIVKNSDAFYCTETEVEGYKVEMYDYRLASYNDFFPSVIFFKENNEEFYLNEDILIDGKKLNFSELRGLTFVHNPISNEWERFILMNKFFNVNQCQNWLENDLKHKRIVRVQDKLDGSIISFVRFPNGVIRAKSKMSFTSDQARMAQEVYDNDSSIRLFISIMIDGGATPIFELTSPDNQIVLEYNKTELQLLQIRYATGAYFDKITMNNTLKEFSVKLAGDFDIEPIVNNTILDHLLALKTVEQNIEGWIVTFEDGQMAKIKTDWYMQLHGLIGPDSFRENLLIKTILDGNIDDVLANLVPGEKKTKIEEMVQKVEHRFNHCVAEFIKLRNSYADDFNSDRKEFALANRTKEMFSAVVKTIGRDFCESEAEKLVKEYFERQTNSLAKAKEWLK